MGKSSSLRNVLKNFLNHYETLEQSLIETKNKIKEIAESGSQQTPTLSLYAQEFLKLKELTESLKNDENCPMYEGHSDVNRKKNRYKDILPYDNSRVILSEYPGVPGSDYINANYVRGSSGNQRAYIASQGPLPNTLVDFWRMIWETEVLVIVMACNEREAGKYKCEPYWPLNTDEKQQYGNITVEHVKWRQVCPDFLVRTFKVCADNEERTICQFHYTTWPDHGVPSSVQPILELVRLMRDVQSTESRPILIHCSAGCGRTGTLCSIDYVWALLRTGKLREDFSLFEIISDMRRQRIAMVQTVEQYILCYRAVATLFEQHLKLIDTHTYENVDDDGEPLGIKNSILLNEYDENEQQQQKQDKNGKNHTSKSLSSASSSSSDSVSSSTSSSSLSSLTMNNDNDNNIIKNDNLSKTSLTNSNSNDVIDSTSKSNNENDLKNLNSEEIHNVADEDAQMFMDNEQRPEKLIGKATVIRRPSIAKLKAIFDNPQQLQQPKQFDHNSDNQQSSSSTSSPLSSTNQSTVTNSTMSSVNNNHIGHSRLQRSQSIKENFRNFNFNFHLEINQPKLPNRKTKSYTMSATKLSVYKKNFNFSDFMFNPEKTSSSSSTRKRVQDICFDRNGSQTTNNDDDGDGDESSSPEASPIEIEDNNNIDEYKKTSKQQHSFKLTPTKKSVITDQESKNNNQHNYNNKMNRPPSLDESTRNAPPKPPRTYQHVYDDSCIIKTSEGRLIVTVAQPIHHHHNQHRINNNNYEQSSNNGQYPLESIYDQLGARKFTYQSSPNLATMAATFFPSSSAAAVMPQPIIRQTNEIGGQFPHINNSTSQHHNYNVHQNYQQQPQQQSLQQSSNKYCDVAVSNAIYSNPLISKSFPLQPPAAMISNPQLIHQHQQQQTSNQLQFNNSVYGNYSQYVDMLNFQQHQAKPIILQPHGYYEPIYGSTKTSSLNQQSNQNSQYLNHTSSLVVPPVQSSSSSTAQQMISTHQQQHMQPYRTKSLTAKLSTNQTNELIYGNPKLINLNNSDNAIMHQQLQGFDINNKLKNQKILKENIYTEIQIKPSPPSSTRTNANENKQPSIDNGKESSSTTTSTSNRFNLLYRAFKLFGFSSSTANTNSNNENNNSGSSSATSSVKNFSISKTTTTNSSKNLKRKTPANINCDNNNPVTIQQASPVTTNLKIQNGILNNSNVPINPINGQPLTRPPHSHRFNHHPSPNPHHNLTHQQANGQPATQWTQV